MAGRKKTDQADILERQGLALELRKAGMTYRDIAKRIGVSFQQAHRDVNDELQRLRSANLSSASELQQLELERLDRAIAGMMHWIDAGSPMHVQALVRCVQERAKMLGLYAPQQHDITWRDVAQESGLSEADIASEFEALVDSAVNKLTEQGES